MTNAEQNTDHDAVNPYAPPAAAETGPIVPQTEVGEKATVPPLMLRMLGGAMIILIAFFLLQDGMLLALQIRENYQLPAMVPIFLAGIMHLFMFNAAQELIRLRSYQLSWYAAVLLCVPCFGSLSVMAMPLGILSVLILRSDGAKVAFSKR